MRHFTHGLLHFLVRLACVKRAASVDSEPGSNSRLNLSPTTACPEIRSLAVAARFRPGRIINRVSSQLLLRLLLDEFSLHHSPAPPLRVSLNHGSSNQMSKICAARPKILRSSAEQQASKPLPLPQARLKSFNRACDTYSSESVPTRSYWKIVKELLEVLPGGFPTEEKNFGSRLLRYLRSLLPLTSLSDFRPGRKHFLLAPPTPSEQPRGNSFRLPSSRLDGKHHCRLFTVFVESGAASSVRESHSTEAGRTHEKNSRADN